MDVGEALRHEDDRGVVLAQLLEPELDPLGEELVEEVGPRLLENDQRRPPVEPLLDPVEEVEERRDDDPVAELHQVRHLEDLEAALAEPVALRVEQSAEVALQRVGPKGLAQVRVLELHLKVGQRAGRRDGEQSERVVDRAAVGRRDDDALQGHERLDPLRGPGALRGPIDARASG